MPGDASFDRALDRVANLVRGDPNVLMVADDADEQGARRILVVLRADAERPSTLPDRVDGFVVVVERTQEIVAHDARRER